ncbi:MAG: hypothetical protein ACPGOY_17245 [Rhodospirillaceae bacterium]
MKLTRWHWLVVFGGIALGLFGLTFYQVVSAPTQGTPAVTAQ